MDIEKVKKILNEFAGAVSEGYGETTYDVILEGYAKEICQLSEPKPVDIAEIESRLLTMKQFREYLVSTGKMEIIKTKDVDQFERFLGYAMETQLVQDIEWEAKTASIKDAECQARICQALNVIFWKVPAVVVEDSGSNNGEWWASELQENNIPVMWEGNIGVFVWQALKKREGIDG